jgi:hypothetical protein
MKTVSFLQYISQSSSARDFINMSATFLNFCNLGVIKKLQILHQQRETPYGEYFVSDSLPHVKNIVHLFLLSKVSTKYNI